MTTAAGNCLKNGLLTIALDQRVIDELWDTIEAWPEVPITVDLVRREVRAAGATYTFDGDDNSRWQLPEERSAHDRSRPARDRRTLGHDRSTARGPDHRRPGPARGPRG